MSNSIKISGDTSELKKSILDVSKMLNRDLKGTKLTMFSNDDKKFIKTELKKDLSKMKEFIKDNQKEIKKMNSELQNTIKGSQEELKLRKDILEAYKEQSKLAKDMGQAQKAHSELNKGSLEGMMSKLPKLLGAGALAIGAYGLMRGVQSNGQYSGGASNRVRLKGLGVNEDNFGSASEMARVGVTEQEMIQRRIDATKHLGRSGTNNDAEMKKAGFERAFGLEGGTMTGVASQFRGQVGGEGAANSQMKIQASILAAGIEDAIGPYLESAVTLLTSINQDGMNSTAEVTAMLARLSKDGGRTPDQIGKTFGGIDAAMKGSSGEANAFLQTAFAKAGIGGGSIGGTRFALSSGGLMGLNKESLSKRGYNPELLKNMEGDGMFSGMGQRTDAVMNLFKETNGGKSISSITDPGQMVGMNNVANSVFGTKGNNGFDALKMLEDVQNKKMSAGEFDKKLQAMIDSQDPQVDRLNKINDSLAGQTNILSNINTNLMEALGKSTVKVGNEIKKLDNEGIKGTTTNADVLNSTGINSVLGGVSSASGYLNRGGYGESVWNLGDKMNSAFRGDGMSQEDVSSHAKKMRDSGKGWKGMTDEQIDAKIQNSMKQQKALTAEDIGKEVGKAIQTTPINNNVMIQTQKTGSVFSDKTNK